MKATKLPHVTEVFPKPGQPVYGRCTVGEFLSDVSKTSAAKDFGFEPFENNRGKRHGEGAARATVELLADPTTRNVGFMGVVTVARVGQTNHFRIADGQSRNKGLKRAAEEKNLTKEEKATSIVVQVCHEDDFMKMHQVSNAHVAHSTNVKLKTPEYNTNRSTVSLSMAVCGKPQFDFVKNDVKFRHKLLQIFVAHRDAADPMKLSLADLTTKAHAEVSKLFKTDAEITFPKEMIDALTYVRNVYLNVQKYTVPLKIIPMTGKFQSEAPLFGFLMIDRMTKKEVTSLEAKDLGFRIAYQMKASAAGSKDSKLLQAARATVVQLQRRELTIQALAELKRYLIPNSKTTLEGIARAHRKSDSALAKIKTAEKDSPINSRLNLNHEKVVAAFQETGKYAEVARRFGTSATSIRRILTGK